MILSLLRICYIIIDARRNGIILFHTKQRFTIQ